MIHKSTPVYPEGQKMGKLGQKNSVLKRKNKNYVQKKLKIPISRVDLRDCSLYIKGSDNVNAYISLQTSLKTFPKRMREMKKRMQMLKYMKFLIYVIL